MISRCSVQEKLGTSPSYPLMNRKYGGSEKYNRVVPPRRSDIGESSKGHGEYNESESRKYIEKKKRKVILLDKLPMEFKKVEARQEPVLKKRKRVTGSGHDFKSKLAIRAKRTVAEKARVSQSEKIPSCQETEKQVQSGNPKKQCPKLKIIYPQGPQNTTVVKASAKEEGYGKQTHLKRKQASKDNDRQEYSRAEHSAKEIHSAKKRPVKETGAGNEIGKDSVRAEGCENRVLSKKNQASKDGGAGNEIRNDCARAECFENQTLSMMKQAMKDGVSGNEIINDSAREERYEKNPSQKKQAVKDKDLGTEIVKDSSKEKHYENQKRAKMIKEVRDKCEGNDTGKVSSEEERHENRVYSKKKQAIKHQGTGDEIEKNSVAGEEHQDNRRITSEEKQGVKDKGARKDIEKQSSREEHCENQIHPRKKQTVKDKGLVGKQVEKDSSKKECSENQILSLKKQAVSDEGVGSTIDSLIDKIKRNCDKRMRKLKKEQEQEVQEFHQSWEVQVSKLETDRKLEFAIIRCLHGKNSARIADKLTLLDGQFAKKMEEFKLLKAVRLKDLEDNHEVARNKEREKQSRWLAEAKPCQSSELEGVCGPDDFGSEFEKVCGFSEPSTQDVMLLTTHNVEDKNPCRSVRGNDVTMSEDSFSTDLQNDVPAPLDLSLSDHSPNTGFDNGDRTGFSGALMNQRDETDKTTDGLPSLGQKDELNKDVSPEVPETVPDIDCLNLVESSDNSSNSRFEKGDGTGLPCALLNQSDGIDETTTSGLPLVGRRLGPAIVLNEIEPVEWNKEVPPEEAETVVTGIVGYANPVELSNNTSSDKGTDEDAIGLPDALVNQGAETDETTTGGLPIVEQILETLELQVSEDEIHQGLNSVVIQDQGAQVVEKKGASPYKEDASEHIDSVEDQDTLQIEVANMEIDVSVNSLQDAGAQVVEKQNSSDHVDSVTLLPSNTQLSLSSNASDKEIDLGDAIGLPDTMVNPGDETKEATIGCLPVHEQLLERSKPPVLEDGIPQGSTSAVIQCHDAHVVEKQNTSLLNGNTSVVEDQATSMVANKEVHSLSPVQDEGAQVVEKQYTSDNVDAVMTSPSNIEVQDQETVEEENFALQIEPGNCEPADTVNPVQYNDASLIYNGDELHIEQDNSEPLDIVNPVQHNDALLIELQIGSSDDSLLCNQPTSIEAENQSHSAERNFPQIAQMEETEPVPQESLSQSESNGELLSNIEPLTSSHNTIDFLHQVSLQPGSLEHLYGPSYLLPDANHQVASWNIPPLYAKSFHMELDRIHAETERLKKSHEDMVLQLGSDRKKEMIEMIAQIEKKYKLKLQDAEAEFSSKKNVLEKKHKKVSRSKLLAECLGYTCLGLCSVGLPGLPQAPVPLQHMMSPPPVATNPSEPAPSPVIAGWNTTRPPTVATVSSQPATSTPIPGPNLQVMQHQPLQHVMGPPLATNPVEPPPRPLIAGWNMMRPPPSATFSGQLASSTPIPGPNFQAMQHQPLQHRTGSRSMATYPGQTSPGPPLPLPNFQAMQQLLLSSQNFAASHVQTTQHAAAPGSFASTSRPPVIGSITPTVGNPHYGGGIHSMPPHLHSSRPTTSFPPVTQHLPPPPGFHNTPQIQGGLTGQSNPLDTLLGHLIYVEDLTRTPLEQANWAPPRDCSVQGNLVAPLVPPDSICLSDDD